MWLALAGPGVTARTSIVIGGAAWHDARKLERNGKTPVAKNTMQPGTHADSITGARALACVASGIN